MSTLEEKIELIRKSVREYPDFPKPGVLFRDLFSVFQKPELIEAVHDVLIPFAKAIQPAAECIVGVDARGFLLGPWISLELKIPFVPARKKGKLPGNVASMSYSLEYGENTLEIQQESIKEGQNVLVVDDLLATGGSLGATCSLVEKVGGKVVGCLVLMELTDLNGAAKVPANVTSVIKF